MRNAMGRVQFCPHKSAILNFNMASLVYLKIDRSRHSISIISMGWTPNLLFKILSSGKQPCTNVSKPFCPVKIE